MTKKKDEAHSKKESKEIVPLNALPPEKTNAEPTQQKKVKERIVIHLEGQDKDLHPYTIKFIKVCNMLKWTKVNDLAVLLGKEPVYGNTLRTTFATKKRRDVAKSFIAHIELEFGVNFDEHSADRIAKAIQPEYFTKKKVLPQDEIRKIRLSVDKANRDVKKNFELISDLSEKTDVTNIQLREAINEIKEVKAQLEEFKKLFELVIKDIKGVEIDVDDGIEDAEIVEE